MITFIALFQYHIGEHAAIQIRDMNTRYDKPNELNIPKLSESEAPITVFMIWARLMSKWATKRYLFWKNGISKFLKNYVKKELNYERPVPRHLSVWAKAGARAEK